jgi:hypothetical protein
LLADHKPCTSSAGYNPDEFYPVIPAKPVIFGNQTVIYDNKVSLPAQREMLKQARDFHGFLDLECLAFKFYCHGFYLPQDHDDVKIKRPQSWKEGFTAND